MHLNHIYLHSLLALIRIRVESLEENRFQGSPSATDTWCPVRPHLRRRGVESLEGNRLHGSPGATDTWCPVRPISDVAESKASGEIVPWAHRVLQTPGAPPDPFRRSRGRKPRGKSFPRLTGCCRHLVPRPNHFRRCGVESLRGNRLQGSPGSADTWCPARPVSDAAGEIVSKARRVHLQTPVPPTTPFRGPISVLKNVQNFFHSEFRLSELFPFRILTFRILPIPKFYRSEK